MITALNVVEPVEKRLLSKIANRLRHNQIKVEHLYCDRAALKCVTYIRYRKSVNWSAVDRFVKAQRNRVLCPAALALPVALGYRRYEGGALSRRMCTNAAFYLLENAPVMNAKTVLIDDAGDDVRLCEPLLELTDSLTVLTKEPALFREEAERLIEERGAVLRVSGGSSALKDADLIIAPGRIETTLECDERALILTAEKPRVFQRGCVLYGWSFDLPQKFLSIKPDFLDDMYFADALYGMGRVYELGSILFVYCKSDRAVHTRASSKKLFRDRLCEKYGLLAEPS